MKQDRCFLVQKRITMKKGEETKEKNEGERHQNSINRYGREKMEENTHLHTYTKGYYFCTHGKRYIVCVCMQLARLAPADFALCRFP